MTTTTDTRIRAAALELARIARRADKAPDARARLLVEAELDGALDMLYVMGHLMIVERRVAMAAIDATRPEGPAPALASPGVRDYLTEWGDGIAARLFGGL